MGKNDLGPVTTEPGIRNLSHITLTTAQSKTLGLGLKFRPTLRSPPVLVFENQVQDFCFSIRLLYKYANQPEEPDFNPKLFVKSRWNPPQENLDLEDNLYKLHHELLEDFQRNFQRWKNNLSREERFELQEPKANSTVCILATDKNLRPAIVSTECLEKEALKHFN